MRTWTDVKITTSGAMKKFFWQTVEMFVSLCNVFVSSDAATTAPIYD